MSGVEVTIPETRNSNAEYTVYVLRVSHLKGTKLTEVRYSQFFELHKKLRKIIKPYPEFPTKRLLRKLDPKVVESRRQSLELYVQALVAQDPIHPLVLAFLGVPDDGYDGLHDGGSQTDGRTSHLATVLCVNWEEVNKRALASIEGDTINNILSGNSYDGSGESAMFTGSASYQDNALVGILTAMYD